MQVHPQELQNRTNHTGLLLLFHGGKLRLEHQRQLGVEKNGERKIICSCKNVKGQKLSFCLLSFLCVIGEDPSKTRL